MSDLQPYFDRVSRTFEERLGKNLIGLYQFGSVALDDYREGLSDLDLICVVRNRLIDSERNTLAQELEHVTLPCPAIGIEIIIVTEEAARHPVQEPAYELKFVQELAGEMPSSNQGRWRVYVDSARTDKEQLIHFQQCRRDGRRLLGVPAEQLFAPVKRAWILTALIGQLEWHKTTILDPIDDRFGVNSVLNAARAIAYAESDDLISKTKGGEWLLSREPENELVREALKIRRTERAHPLDKAEIAEFLEKAIRRVRLEMS